MSHIPSSCQSSISTCRLWLLIYYIYHPSGQYHPTILGKTAPFSGFMSVYRSPILKTLMIVAFLPLVWLGKLWAF